MRGSKIPVQELWLKMGGGRIREGGRNSGILRYMYLHYYNVYYVTCYYVLLLFRPKQSPRKRSQLEEAKYVMK